MDKFILQVLELEGFKTFIERTVIDFTRLGPGLHYLKGDNQEEPELGSNGAGKSSIWEAICWCLQGVTLGSLRGPDLRPWTDHKGPTWVGVKAVIGAKPHWVVRQQNPNLLTLDGDECSQDTLDKLLPQSMEFITRTMIMGQRQPLFFNMTPRAKMDMFSEVLDLDRWERRSDHAKKVLEIRQSRLMDLQSAVESCTALIRLLKSSADAAREKHDKWEEDRAKRVADIERTIKSVEKEQAVNQERLDVAMLAVDGAGAEAKALLKEIDERRADLASARHFYNKYEARLDLERRQYAEVKQELKDLGEGSECPTCGQPTKGTAFEKRGLLIKRELVSMKAFLDKGIPDKLTAAVSLAQKKLDTSIGHRDKYLDQEDTHRATVTRCAPLAGEYKARIAMLKAEIARSEEGGNPHRAELSELRKRREKLVGDRDALSLKKTKLTALIARTKFWVKGFKDIRLLVIDEVLSQLEIKTNAILQEVGLHRWKITYAIDRETKSGKVRHGLDVLILSPKNKKAVKWECWSGGEGQRLLIVGALALSKTLLDYVGIETNLEVLDEPTQYIGEEGIEDIIELLADRASRLKRTIIYTDHGARESARFATVMTVTRTARGSEIDVDA